jgi:DnaD/phage-associated family protein
MKRQWIKLYLEIINDPKMGQLQDWLWRRAIELFLLAGENGDDGLLQPVSDLAWRLRTPETRLTESLQALSQVGVVHETPEGWVVTHFKERQYSESYERVKRFRERYSNGDCNGGVAEKESSSSSSSSSNLPLDSSSDSKELKAKNVFSSYQGNIGVLTPMIADGLKADIEDYSEEWVLSAIEYATKQEKRSLSYVEGCLRGWKRDGLINPPGPRQPKSTKDDNQPSAYDIQEARKLKAWESMQKLEVSHGN